ncbi:MAG: preprotein translocase subunit SecE [Candidatus Omnitrophica bacterium]|nr:preprotein translocase subunit SecE [Candidatus Omnitrophota bacterium]MBU1924873.1 preprotein translocase subunit SecE [Candidatus Omnitrophota bacterium]
MNKIKAFFSNVKLEMFKVSWPTREELLNSTAVVVVSVALLAVFIGMADLFFTFMVGLIIK